MNLPQSRQRQAVILLLRRRIHAHGGRRARGNVALILAGGRGTRLMPITESLPKPMIPVAGTPILERVINHLVGFGVTRIVLSIGYLGDKIVDYFDDGSNFGCDITYLEEDPQCPRGTGGPIASLPDLFVDLKDPILVLNGDLVTQFDVAAMLRHHIESRSVVTIGAINYAHEIPYGVLEIDSSGEITGIHEKPTRQELVSGGVYVFDASIAKYVTKGNFVPMTDVLAGVIFRKEKVTFWQLDDGWADVGRMRDLVRVQGMN
jgi:NDP-sugar pyrophosphorylase family protein